MPKIPWQDQTFCKQRSIQNSTMGLIAALGAIAYTELLWYFT